MEDKNKPTLWYFADPMCSWCWGFSSVMAQIKQNYAEKINIALVMGGLRAGETQVLSDSSREDILHHWRQVEEMTGQTFSFEGALEGNFIYDTEPACRAVISVGLIEPSKKFSYLTAIQAAFYTKNQDITQSLCLQEIAVECGIDAENFNSVFFADAQRESAQKNFQFTKKAGVSAFPTLILNMKEELHDVTRGYQNYEKTSSILDNYLSL